MSKIDSKIIPIVNYHLPKNITFYGISDEDLNQLEAYGNIGFQGNFIWISLGAVSGAVVFFYEFFFNINELSVANKLAGLVDTTIFASGILISLIL